jgi:hypothetical protein
VAGNVRIGISGWRYAGWHLASICRDRKKIIREGPGFCGLTWFRLVQRATFRKHQKKHLLPNM